MMAADVAERDAQLVARASAGDRAAWDDIVRAHEPALIRLTAALLRDRDEARDVCQETFKTAFGRLGDFEPGTRLDLWIRRIAINRARDVLRRRGVRHATEQELSRMPEHAASPAEILSDREDRLRLERALHALPIDFREALVAHILEDRDYRELAEMLGLSVNAVRIRVHRAFARLRELMKENA